MLLPFIYGGHRSPHDGSRKTRPKILKENTHNLSLVTKFLEKKLLHKFLEKKLLHVQIPKSYETLYS